MTRKRKITVLIMMLLVVSVATVGYLQRYIIGYVALAYLCGIPCVSEEDESSNLVKFVSEHYRFVEKSKSMPEKTPIFYRPGGTGILGQTPHTVIVYTVTDVTEQNKIIELISGYRVQHGLRHIKIKFYREENWRTWVSKDGSRGGARGKEELIRRERL